MHSRVTNIRANYIECDEVWCFVGKKARRVRKADPVEFGDQWVFVALDAGTKLIPCFSISGLKFRAAESRIFNGKIAKK